MKMNQSKAGNLLYTNGRIVQKGDFALISGFVAQIANTMILLYLFL